MTGALIFTGTSPIHITASIAFLSACTFVRLAAVPVSFSETGVDAAGPKGSLKGTLLTPTSKPTSVVLIVLGSGPTDKDEILRPAEDKKCQWNHLKFSSRL